MPIYIVSGNQHCCKLYKGSQSIRINSSINQDKLNFKVTVYLQIDNFLLDFWFKILIKTRSPSPDDGLL